MNLADFAQGFREVALLYRSPALVHKHELVNLTNEACRLYLTAIPTELSGRTISPEYSRWSSKIAIVVLAFGLASIRFRLGLDNAEQQTENIAAEIRRQFDDRPLDDFWTKTLDVLAVICLREDLGAKAAYQEGLSWGKKGEKQLELLYRIAAFVNSPPNYAFRLTMATFTRPLLPWTTATQYHTVVVPCLRDYWRWSVDHFWVYFPKPERTRLEIDEMLSVAGEAGLKRVLLLVAERLNLSLSDSDKQYLNV